MNGIFFADTGAPRINQAPGMDMLSRGRQYKSYPQTRLRRLATRTVKAFKLMAMALSCSCSFALAASLSSLSLASATTSAFSQWKPALAPLSGNSIALGSGFRQRDVVVVVRAAEDVMETSTSEADEAPAIVNMLSEADVLKKKAKKAELRRRRLVRKRKLRKKGKWPPSKMAKLKNV